VPTTVICLSVMFAPTTSEDTFILYIEFFLPGDLAYEPNTVFPYFVFPTLQKQADILLILHCIHSPYATFLSIRI
jgi:hypothetical protein